MFLRIFKPEVRRLAGMLVVLTSLFIAWQISFFLIHFKVSTLLDSLVKTSVATQLLNTPVLLPLIWFIGVQLMGYAFLIAWVVFVSSAFSLWFKWSNRVTYGFGLLTFFMACVFLLVFNAFYFPSSFFSVLLFGYGVTTSVITAIFYGLSAYMLGVTLLAFTGCYVQKRIDALALILVSVMVMVSLLGVYQRFFPVMTSQNGMDARWTSPNVILIGLDSLRPDFLDRPGVNTPTINEFVKSGVTFEHAYTPLARTYPAWVSILTGKHPVHTSARNNLVNPKRVLQQDTMARYFQRQGYETIYATDEKRFSNITPAYGFDKVYGPKMGVNDFLIGGLGDFPMGNVLLRTPLGPYAMPYHFANRAVHVTYDPNDFLQQVKWGLNQRTLDKPLFLSVHLCLSHWPFTWASDGSSGNETLVKQYQHSVEGVDKQLKGLLTLLSASGLLENSWVVLLSDHGTSLGLPHDKLTDASAYRGDPIKLQWVPALKLSQSRHYSMNTTYGQGTDVLGGSQYRVLLSFRRFGEALPAKVSTHVASLMDIWPTMAGLLNGPDVSGLDGVSLYDAIWEEGQASSASRSLFLETGDSLSEIETDHIYIEKVIKRQIGIYHVDQATGLLMMDQKAADAIVKNKQLAVMKGDWLLAHYPPRKVSHLVNVVKHKELQLKTEIIPDYFILANLKTKQWTIDLSSPFARAAPSAELLRELADFYPGEIRP